MPFGVVSGVGRGMGVLDRVEIVEGEAAVLPFWGKCEASHYNQWGLCGVAILSVWVATRLFPNYFGISC